MHRFFIIIQLNIKYFNKFFEFTPETQFVLILGRPVTTEIGHTRRENFAFPPLLPLRNMLKYVRISVNKELQMRLQALFVFTRNVVSLPSAIA